LSSHPDDDLHLWAGAMRESMKREAGFIES